MKINYQIILDNTIKEITEKNLRPKLLLHSCCAPCSSYVLNYLSIYFDITIYYYNPNIDSYDEYDKRSKEQIRLIEQMELTNKVNYIIEQFDNTEYYSIVKGLEDEPEGGKRCDICYNLRLEKTAKYAKEHEFDYFTTTLSISPYKNSQKLNMIGLQLEKKYNVLYLQSDFKKKNGYKTSIELSHKYNLYRQDYCGCKYSKIEHEKKIEQKKQLENNEKKEFKNEQSNEFLEDIKYDKKKTKKLSILLIGIILIISFVPAYLLFAKFTDDAIYIKCENEESNINELYVYGNHFNIKGSLEIGTEIKFDKVMLSFKNHDNYFDLDLSYTYDNGIINYYISDKLNTGFKLDNLKIGNYDVFLKLIDSQLEKNNEKYYALNNKTNYKQTDYYTITKDNKNNKVIITSDDKYKTLVFNVSRTNDEVYDICIDPGHGGNDSGACLNETCETKYTLDFANILKEKLEKNGLKVKLTRNNNETLKTYGENSRTGIPYESHTKYVISLHMNAGANYSGFEFYTSNNIDYSLANKIVDNLNSVNDFHSSPSTFNRVSENGIFTRTMSEHDLNEFVTDAIENNYEKYNVSNQTNYYYMIRETGGYMSGAYVDGREGNRNNPYVLSNVGNESYILELGYITSTQDQDYMNKYKNDYLNAVGDAFISYINN